MTLESMVKITPPKFKLDLCFVVHVISIVYKFHLIWLRQTKVWERKPTLGCTGGQELNFT